MADLPPIATCAACAAPLAHEQRYCMTCGARRGALPRVIQAHLARLRPASPAPERPAPERPAPAPSPLLSRLPSPRAAAVAVLAMLGAGAAIGAGVGGTADAGSAPVIVAVAPPSTAPTAAPAAATPPPVPATTRTVTVPAPSAAPAADTAAPAADAAPTSSTPAATPPAAGPTLPPIKHVWWIVLSGSPGADQTFSPTSAAPYLGATLTKAGELVPNYYAVAHGGLANEVALLSGQGPTAGTAADCPQYGEECVNPKTVESLPDQLAAEGFTARFYVQGVPAPDPSLPPGACARPASGAPDPDHDVRPDGAYVTWRNPVPYFAALVDSPTCAASVVSTDRLATDLTTAAATPAFSYLVPDRCHDGSLQTACPEGTPTGLASADAWLQGVVPPILASPAYKDGGLVAITFDEAPADSSSCCGQPAFPGVASSATPASTATPADPSSAIPASDGTPPGGGRVGLLLLSPFVKAGTTNGFGVFNHFSLLRSVEDLFSVPHLGHAGDAAVPAFDSVVYDATPTG